VLSAEDQAKISRMQMDLRWLVGEGYVTEFRDGRLFAQPPMVEARKKEIEGGEHDPENFPEAPAPTPPSAPSPASREESPPPAADPADPADPADTASAASAEPESAEQPEAPPPPEPPAAAETDPEAGETDKPADGS
jgi:hypothetical protein